MANQFNTDDHFVLLALHKLWPRMRLRNPATADELQQKDAIRVALETRFGEIPRLPRPEPRDPVAVAPKRDYIPEGEYELIHNTRLVHGNALKKHAHSDVAGFPHDRDFYVHLHGPQSHAREQHN